MSDDRTDQVIEARDPRHVELMRRAIAVAKEGIAASQSPFGAAIATTEGQVVVEAHNKVRISCDATAHAEITAIREACTKLQRTDLSGHVIATTCEPCPMCATAIHWARIETVVFGAAIADAKRVHFNELTVPMTSLFLEGESPVKVVPNVLRQECIELFEIWKKGPNPYPY